MLTLEAEIEAFKSLVNLTEFAAASGYLFDRKASSRNCAVMEHPDGDKIVIAVASDGHWVYFSVRDDQDHGTIIDFVQRRQGVSLGHVRKILRPWLGGHSPSLPSRPADGSFAARLEPVARDIAAVRARFEAMVPVRPDNAYLTGDRRIPPTVLASPRFAEFIRTDSRGNVVFPHSDDHGLCGFELKRRSFTGFAPGGTKAVWMSGVDPGDTSLAVAESGIDAVSYAAIRGFERTRFASIAGQMNETQPGLLIETMRALPATARVVLAFDNDDAGDELTRTVAALFAGLDRPDLSLDDDRPATRGRDWNDALRNSDSSCEPCL